MAQDVATLTPENSILSAEVGMKSSLFLANVAAIPAFTPLKRDANKKLIPATATADTVVGLSIPFAGSNNVAGLLPMPISAVDFKASYYTEGAFASAAISWAAYTTPPATDQAKQAVFDNTEIEIVFAGAGW